MRLPMCCSGTSILAESCRFRLRATSASCRFYYNRKPTARRGYLFDTTGPLYPFGFGLSYTSFEFRRLAFRSAIAYWDKRCGRRQRRH